MNESMSTDEQVEETIMLVVAGTTELLSTDLRRIFSFRNLMLWSLLEVDDQDWTVLLLENFV